VIIAQRVAETLVELGIRRVYGLPGEDHMTLLDAFAAAGIQYFTAANESSSVIMAAVDAKVSGTPSVVVLSLAPGISNGVNGLLHAYMEGAPVLVISGQHGAARQPFVVRQGFDLHKLVEPVTKWMGHVSASTDPTTAVCKALDIASASRPGPVYLEIPDEVAKAEEPSRSGAIDPVQVLKEEWSDRGTSRVAGAAPTDGALARLKERLAAAKHPALVIGGRDANISQNTLAAFSEKFSVPVFTSTNQKGLATSGSPFYAGTFLNGSLESSILSRSDLILMVNPESFDTYNTPWRYDAFTVALSSAASDEWLYPYSSRVVADPESTLRLLLENPTGASEWTTGDVVAYREYVTSELRGEGDTALSVVSIVESALGSSTPDTRLIADAGFSKPIVAMLSEPGVPSAFLASNALSTMGFSIPAALAASRASDRPVLAFLGDGSLLMRASELALHGGLTGPLVVIAVMDQALSQIEIKQERLGLTTVGVSLPYLSCKSLGEAFGFTGVDVDDEAGLKAALATAWSSASPTLIGAHISPESSRRVFELMRG
jgi:acetolactate synthase-1/2/3 large subunit